MKPRFPTSQSFADAFGFDVPTSFQTFIRIVFQCANEDFDGFRRITADLFFLRPSTELISAFGSKETRECRYHQTPLELVPFGDHGVDGAHIGFVVATPELPAAEFPIGVFNPMDFDVVALSGMSFKAALDRRVGELVADRGSSLDSVGLRLLHSLKQEFKLSAEAVQNDMGWSTQKPICMPIPPDYDQLPTSDGISVLAPKQCFSKQQHVLHEDLDKALHTAKQFSKDELWGNSLHALREAAWRNNEDDAARRLIAQSMAVVYKKLRRPLLANLASRRADGEF